MIIKYEHTVNILCHLYMYITKYFTLPGDLLYYGGVEWLNISDFLGKIKKGLELHAMCFVFKSAVVFLCKERLRQKKKLMVSVLLLEYVFSCKFKFKIK